MNEFLGGEIVQLSSMVRILWEKVEELEKKVSVLEKKTESQGMSALEQEFRIIREFDEKSKEIESQEIKGEKMVKECCKNCKNVVMWESNYNMCKVKTPEVEKLWIAIEDRNSLRNVLASLELQFSPKNYWEQTRLDEDVNSYRCDKFKAKK